MFGILNKIKTFFNNIWQYLVLVLGILVAVLYFVLRIKNAELEATKEQLALAQTQKDVDLIEAGVKEKMAQNDLNKSQRQGLEQSLSEIEKKRNSLSDPRVTDQDRADYWDKK